MSNMTAERRRPKLDDTARIRHMLDATRRACELAQGKAVGCLDPDSETALALTRLLEILGEAAKNVTQETQANHRGVPWRDIADTRNRIIHEYFDVDYDIVEALIRSDLPPLIKQLEVVLQALQTCPKQL